jgi:hypothetical protein
MTPIGTILYLALVVASLIMSKRVLKWEREVVFIDDLGRPHFGYRLHYLLGFASLALVLSGHMFLSGFSMYTIWLLQSQVEAAKAGWFCFTTVGGFLVKPSQSVAGLVLKPSQTRRVRVACGFASGAGLGILIVRYLPFIV